MELFREIQQNTTYYSQQPSTVETVDKFDTQTTVQWPNKHRHKSNCFGLAFFYIWKQEQPKRTVAANVWKKKNVNVR